MTLARQLKQLRERAGLSIVRVIEAIGVSRAVAYAWEDEGPNGKAPGPGHLQALLELYRATDVEQLAVWRLLASRKAA